MAREKQAFRVIKCPRLCSINDYNLPAGLGGLIHAWIEDAVSDAQIEQRTTEHGHRISERAVRNHRLKHLMPEKQMWKSERGKHVRPAAGDGMPDEKFTDLEVIEEIIKAGGKQLLGRTAVVSPEMTMRAIELKYKMTQGSMMDDFFRAMGMVMDDAMDDESAAATMTENQEATNGASQEAESGEALESGSLDVQAMEARVGEEVPSEREAEGAE